MAGYGQCKGKRKKSGCQNHQPPGLPEPDTKVFDRTRPGGRYWRVSDAAYGKRKEYILWLLYEQ